MATLNVQSVADFVSSVQKGAEEAAGAFARTFDTTATICVGKSGPFDAATLPVDFWKPGLVLVLVIGDAGVVILIPSASGLVPDWCENPDATGKSKLATFAQEWGLNLIPEDFFADENLAAVVPDMGKAVVDYGTIDENAAFVEILIDQAGQSHPAYMIWPVLHPNEVLKIPEPEVEEPEPEAPSFALPPFGGPVPGLPGMFDSGAGNFDEGDYGDSVPKPLTVEDLPGFSHSVLKIRIPVAAVLARARKPIRSILELGIGSVIQFDKPCDDPIELEIDRTIIGNGEAVKVGDKFGLRINTILLPKERFHRVEIRREGDYNKQKRPLQIIGKAPIKSLEPPPKNG